jgi:hypothetical protein
MIEGFSEKNRRGARLRNLRFHGRGLLFIKTGACICFLIFDV